MFVLAVPGSRVFANQPAEGHPANDTWDYGQLYRLHMIRAQAAQEFKSFNITEDDVDNYLIRSALADNQLDNDAASSSTSDQRRVPRRQVNKLPTAKKTNSSIDRCEHRGSQQEQHRMSTLFEPRRQRRPSSSASTRTPSTSGTYLQSWIPEQRRLQLCQKAQ